MILPNFCWANELVEIHKYLIQQANQIKDALWKNTNIKKYKK